MVRQISQSRGLYTAKVVKATDTPSGFSTWEQKSPGERLTYRLCSIPTTIGTNTESEGAAASKGLDGNLSPSAGGTYRERGNCCDPASPRKWRLTWLRVNGHSRAEAP
jgi:hypothetical protein